MSDGSSSLNERRPARNRRAVRGGLLAASMLFVVGAAGFAGIENPTCELIGPSTYRINYESPPETGAIEVFASGRPDRIDSAKPVATIRRAPAEVSVPGRSGRVYFHLKPASGTTRVVSLRQLPLEGAANFRDLGGYRTSDGRYVRWGMVYRSNDLSNLTAKDYEYLDSLGIRLVCDVRLAGERMRSPTHWIGRSPQFLTTPIGRERDGALTPEEDLRNRLAALATESKTDAQAYDQYAFEYASQYGNILQRLVAGNLPLIEHCSSGKDRTGVFSAILLTALGVPRDTVIQDYLLTSQYMLADDRIEQTAVDVQRILGLSQPPDVATVRTLMTTRPEKMEATLDSIVRAYGSFSTYLRDALKLSDSDLSMLRNRLLEP
jgi:protein-tyrosine phosphatase